MMSCLLEASELWLRTKLELSSDRLGISLDRKPPPTLEDTFVAIYGLAVGTDSPDLNSGLDCVFDIGLTITKRTRYNPLDYARRTEMLADTTTISHLLWRCIAWLHQEPEVPYRANQLLNKLVANNNGFIEPLRFIGIDVQPTFVKEDWFAPEMSLNAPRIDATYPYCGLIMEATLGNARRVMTIAKLREEARLA